MCCVELPPCVRGRSPRRPARRRARRIAVPRAVSHLSPAGQQAGRHRHATRGVVIAAEMMANRRAGVYAPAAGRAASGLRLLNALQHFHTVTRRREAWRAGVDSPRNEKTVVLTELRTELLWGMMVNFALAGMPLFAHAGRENDAAAPSCAIGTNKVWRL